MTGILTIKVCWLIYNDWSNWNGEKVAHPVELLISLQERTELNMNWHMKEVHKWKSCRNHQRAFPPRFHDFSTNFIGQWWAFCFLLLKYVLWSVLKWPPCGFCNLTSWDVPPNSFLQELPCKPCSGFIPKRWIARHNGHSKLQQQPLMGFFFQPSSVYP